MTTSENARLKTCPFCKGYNIQITTTGSEFQDEKYAVWCDDCSFYGPATSTYDVAAEAWNRRGK